MILTPAKWIAARRRRDGLRVWFCTLCRDDIQIGAKPDICPACGDGESLVPFQVPYVT